ncbi:MAG TPA: T9SS type A sorting domain-containing protein [Bacteroidetes bacterium]|nr:T9SS type A sorting domain-containing protein [Bacteroidota bacterium]
MRTISRKGGWVMAVNSRIWLALIFISALWISICFGQLNFTRYNITWRDNDLDPPSPPDACDLVMPENDAVLLDTTALFRWTRVFSPNEEITINYQLQWDDDDEFEDYSFEDAGEDTSFLLTGLADDSEYWWRVLSIDPESELSTLSNQTWRFLVAKPEPPGGFELREPSDGDTLTVDEAYEVHFSWERSIDPDPGDTVVYDMALRVTGFDDRSFDQSRSVDTDTSFDYSIITLLRRHGIEMWDGYLTTSWRVEAVSGADRIACEDPFVFYIEPHSSVRRESPGEPVRGYEIVEVFPNPFNEEVRVVFNVPVASVIRAEVYDVHGRRISLIGKKRFDPGHHLFTWRPNSTSGIYFLTISNGSGWRGVVKLMYLE